MKRPLLGRLWLACAIEGCYKSNTPNAPEGLAHG